MQQESLVDAHPLSVAHTEPTCANRESESPRTGRCTQGTALATTASLSDQCQPCQSSQAVHHACSAQDSNSASTTHTHRQEIDMDTSPSTPPGRGVPAPSTRPPDAPRKSKQARPPIQLSPNAPVRKLDFDSSLLRSQASNDSEQSCNSRHSGRGRG